MARSSYKYTGILAQPIDAVRLHEIAFQTRNTADGEKNSKKALVEESRQRNERWQALQADLGVDSDSPYLAIEMLVKLAFRHVPGFENKSMRRLLSGLPGEPKDVGRPKESIKRHGEMVALVDEHRARGRKISEAVSSAARKLGLNKSTAERDYRRFKGWEKKMTKARQELGEEFLPPFFRR